MNAAAHRFFEQRYATISEAGSSTSLDVDATAPTAHGLDWHGGGVMTRRQRGDLEAFVLLIVIFITCSVSLRGEDLHNDVPGAPVAVVSP